MNHAFEYIRSYYNVPARKGARVEFTASNGKTEQGTITGTSGPHILVKLDDAKFSLPYHPTWGIRYLDQDGDSLQDRRQASS